MGRRSDRRRENVSNKKLTMYKIFIRNQEPVFIENGAELMRLWQENQLPARMVIKNIAFYCADIRSITKMEDEPKVGTSIDSALQQKEYNEYRTSILSMPPEERGKRLMFANMLWNAYRLGSKQEMPEDIKEKIIERQVKFFQENPKRIHANPICYKDLVEWSVMGQKDDKFNHISGTLPVIIMRSISEAVRTDGAYAQ